MAHSRASLWLAAVILPAVSVLILATPCAAQDTGQIQPILQCVDFLPDNVLRGHFGYVSTYTTEVTFPLGPDNFFSPGVLFRGQPTTFQPGIHNDVFTTSFAVSGSSTQITWFIGGNIVTAKQSTTLLCSVHPRGEWDPAGTYESADLVSYNFHLYVAYAQSSFGGCGLVAPTVNCWMRFWASPPLLSTIPDQTTAEGTPLALSVQVTDPDGIWHTTLLAETSDPTLIPLDGIVFSGEDANRTITMTPAPQRNGTARVTIHVTDGVMETRQTFIVTVTPAGPPSTLTGSGFNFPELPAYRATFSIDTGGAVRYVYSRTRMTFASTSVSAAVLTGSTLTVQGAGTINGTPGYTFMATATDGMPDAFGIVIRHADNSVYYQAAPLALDGGAFTMTP